MRTPLVLLVSASLVACGAGESGDGADQAEAMDTAEAPQMPTFADAEVQRVHDRMMAALDPEGRYAQHRYLAFSWVVQRPDGEPVARSHRWDRWSGDARVESETDEGTFIATFNTNDPSAGRAWLAGQELGEADRGEWLQRAHGMHINDGYWLIMPFKWADPGVNTRYLGEQTDDAGRSWEVVELSFEDVGRTPQNMYHAYINPASGLMERWAHFRTADADPSIADWTDYTDVGGVQIPMNRPFSSGARIYFEGVELNSDVPADAFSGPA